MKKQQYFLVGGGLTLLILLYFFGNTIPPKKPAPIETNVPHAEKKIETEKLLLHAKEKLTQVQIMKITSLENSISRGDIKEQQIKVYQQLASFWKDSIHLFEPYVYYLGEAAKLENSEKSLTFAAHLFLASLKTEADVPIQNWLATNGKVLFEQALKINPANDSSKVGLGSCYVFGNISDNPMEGIAKIREVVRRNPDDMFAHMMLGWGGMKSTQFDKAIGHFKIIVGKQPDNLEAILKLAECYQLKEEMPDAIKWYKLARTKVVNAETQKALDERIKTLQNYK